MSLAIIKLSGKTIDDFLVNPEWLKILIKLKAQYNGLLIVHGAGNQISEWCQTFGLDSKFINGQRVTDEQVIKIVASVQSGLINGRIVSYLCSKGFDAVGLTGIDNNLFVADYHDKNLGYVGAPKSFKNTKWIIKLIKSSIIPVFSSICRDKEGNLMNVNADIFTNILAATLKAHTVFFISDVNGVILNGETLDKISIDEIVKGINENEINGGMIPKLNSCINLLSSGVNRIWIGNNLFNLFGAKTSSKGTWIVATK